MLSSVTKRCICGRSASVPRLVRRRPWLSAPEALLDALWGALD
ncbi:MAG: hypothetical protein ACI9U2_003960 [Bradymonadia bacterium]|jgi:hypothetical protein